MNQPHFADTTPITARVLGALFCYPPQREDLAPLVSAFRDGSWVEQWPDTIAPELMTQFAMPCEESLPAAFQRLFIGPYALPVPPWGSVWLDRENVLFGDSTVALRQWMRENNIAFETQENQPEDHFGVLLLLSAWLKEQQQEALWQQLLALHLLPWSARFLSEFITHAGHPFYSALGQLTQRTLALWQTELQIPVASKKLYR